MITLYVLAFIIASLLYRRRHRHIDMRTVRRLELERYMGRWYEIARYDRPFERRLRNIEARYTLRADGNVEMEPGRHRHPHRTPAHVVPARPANATERTAAGEKLHFPPHRLLHPGTGRSVPVGARGQHRTVRRNISRQPRIRRDTLRHIVGLAERRGYPLDRLRLLRAPQ